MATTAADAGAFALVRRFFAYYRPHRRLFLLDFACAVLSGVLELAFPVMAGLFVDRLLPGHDWRKIVLAVVGLLAIYVLNSLLMIVVTYWGHKLGISIETEMRRRSFDHLQKLSFRFYDNNKTGHLVGRVTKDLEEIGEVAHHGPEDAFVAIMTFVGAFVLMFLVNAKLAIVTVLVVPPITLVSLHYGGQMASTWKNLFRSVGEFNHRIEENVGGIRVVQAFTNEDHERTLFARDNARYRDTKLDAYRIMAASMTLNYASMRFTQLVVMLAGSYFVLQGTLSEGEFVTFLLLVNVFFRPMEKIMAVMEIYPKGIAGFRSYLELLAIEPDIADKPKAIEVGRLRGDIRFEQVTFGYTPGRPILKQIDLQVQAGESVAFVGPSGAGKTTIASLLPRFYEVEGGRITIDGIDIRDMTLASLRREIGIVQQDVFLFGGTIRENIAYGRLDATDADIEAAARRAKLDTMIADLPAGFETVIGERGVKLSGGQKQRLAIARMFVKNPPILILDEATSALDTETERQIQAALEELALGRTTLIIAHRLATIQHTDRIVVVDQNGVVEQGKHAELLARDGVYRRLHAAQFEPIPA